MKKQSKFRFIILLLFVLDFGIRQGKMNAQSFPNASFTYTIGSGGTVYFTSTSSNTTNLKFWWQFGDGTLLTNTLQTTSHTYTANGRYVVVLALVTLTGSAVRDSVTEVVTINNLITDLRQNEIKKGDGFKIKSHHALKYFDLEFETPPNKNFSVYLFDINGKKVFSQDFLNPEQCRINIENLNSGLYTLCIQSDNLFERKKIFIHNE